MLKRKNKETENLDLFCPEVTVFKRIRRNIYQALRSMEISEGIKSMKKWVIETRSPFTFRISFTLRKYSPFAFVKRGRGGGVIEILANDMGRIG